MSRSIETRLVKMEKHRAGPAATCVLLPPEAWDYGDEHLQRVTAEAIRDHQERTGYRGPVLIGVQPCATAEEWMSCYSRSATGG